MDDPQQKNSNRPLHILLVEDDVLNQFLINLTLDEWGMNTQTAENGKEAISLVEKEQFDLILMDMQMPVMDGYEAIQKIRAMEGAKRHLPIISLSASDSASEIERCLATGANAHVIKPFEPDTLYKLIHQLTSAQQLD